MTDAAELEEGQFMPVTQFVGERLSDKPTTDHKALVIAMELDWVHHAQLVKLAEIGIASLKKREDDLFALARAIEKGEAEATPPLSADDVRLAASSAGRLTMESMALVDLIRRPPS